MVWLLWGNRYNGSSLATYRSTNEVVIVTLNYRLGLFGFFQVSTCP